MLTKILNAFLLTLWILQAVISTAFILDRILAVVNGEVISLSDVERELFFFDNVDPHTQADGKNKFSDSAIEAGTHKLINHKLLLAEAKRFDVENPDEARIQRDLEKIQKRFASQSEFEKALHLNTITQEDLRQMVKEHLKVNRFVDQRIRFFVIVLPAEMSKYYSENQENFQGKTYEEAEKEINQILLTLKGKGKLEDLLLKLKANAEVDFVN